MRRAATAARKPIWRSCWPRMRPGPRPTCASRPTAASALPRNSTSSASSARPGSTRWRRSRPISSCRTSPSTCWACPAPTEKLKMLPLEGITVIAVEQAVAAPFCSSRRADAGAYVIKGERPEGDFAPGHDAAAKGQSSYFVWLNRGKDSVVIDLATKQGRQNLEELIAGADVLIQNLKPGSMDKLGFSLARLRKDYPKLICCTISGYGDDGPYAQRKAYDLLIQAESGLASITGGTARPCPVGRPTGGHPPRPAPHSPLPGT